MPCKPRKMPGFAVKKTIVGAKNKPVTQLSKNSNNLAAAKAKLKK